MSNIKCCGLKPQHKRALYVADFEENRSIYRPFIFFSFDIISPLNINNYIKDHLPTTTSKFIQFQINSRELCLLPTTAFNLPNMTSRQPKQPKKG